MHHDPWPLALAAFLPWFDNFRTKLVVHGPTLGIPAARVTQVGQEYAWLFYSNADTQNAEAEWHERVAWRDIFFRGDDGAMLGTYPTNNSIAVAAPPAPPAGVLARLRALVQLMKNSTAYDEAIGSELGILTPPPSARPPKPTPVAAPGENSHVMIDSPLRGWSAQEIESRRGTGGWELIAVALKRKHTDTRPPLAAGQPEVREYRLRYRDGDVPEELFSDIVKVTTKP